MRRFQVAVLSRKALFVAPVGAALLGTVLMAATARFQPRTPDFDGDGRPDVAMWRPPTIGGVTSGTFYAGTAKDNFATVSAALGAASDIPLMGDFDGDGKTVLAVYSPFGTHAWSIRLSSQGWTSIATFQWGTDGDIPLLGDFDNDGKTDIGVFRPSEGKWYVLLSKTGFVSGASASWGSANSIPVPADYDGDGRVDIASIEPVEFNGLATWYILQGGTDYRSAYAIEGFGPPGVTYVPADFDGDGKVDAAYYDPLTSTFTVRTTKDGAITSKVWGIAGDIPAPADYDGDGKADLAVFRPTNNTYYVQTAASNFTNGFSRTFGLTFRAGDVPVLAR